MTEPRIFKIGATRVVSKKVSGSEGTSEKPAINETDDCEVASSSEVLDSDPDKTQSEHFPQFKTALFLQQLIFPQSAVLARLSHKH